MPLSRREDPVVLGESGDADFPLLRLRRRGERVPLHHANGGAEFPGCSPDARRARRHHPGRRGSFRRRDARTRGSVLRQQAGRGDFYRQQLYAPHGRDALAYLRGRGFSEHTIERFQLGFAPDSWDALLRHARVKKLPAETLERAGLVIRRESGGFYDRFRNRVVFPLMNLSGRVVGFGARRMAEDEESPKYINSPETAVYQKGSTLYGLYQSRDAIRKRDFAIVVEGYTDLISLHQAGIENVVATLGTALTSHQAKLLRRYTEHVVLFYDSDSPGFAAAMRGAQVMLEQSLDVRIASVPEGHDPDSFVREKGAEAVLKHLEGAVDLFEFELRRLSAGADLSRPEVRVEIARKVLEAASHIGDRLKRAAWVSRLAETLRVDEGELMAELRQMLRRQRRDDRRGQTESAPARPRSSRILEAEKNLIAILLRGREVVDYVLEGLEEYRFRDPRLAQIFDLYQEQLTTEGRVDVAWLMGHIQDAWAAEFVASVLDAPEDMYESRQLAEDSFRTLRLEELDRELAAVQDQLRSESEGSGDTAELTRRLMDLLSLRRKLETGELDPRKGLEFYEAFA
ncbi:MAG: DNA primase [Calditrichaeota bacterium]|nr:DNA primase [Calditrichota bacterium]